MVGKINGLRQSPFCNMRKSSIKTSYFDKFDRKYYTTDGYDDYLTRFEKEGQDTVQKLIKVIAPDPGWCFLDVGCGMGGTILALKKLGFEAWGTEVSKFCLEFSPAKKWIKMGNACEISYPDASFNVVICIDVLCYLNKREVMQASKELVRVAKHYLYIETICKGSPNSSQKKNLDLLRNKKNLLTANEIKKIFEDNDTLFLEPLYPKEELQDFNGVFIK